MQARALVPWRNVGQAVRRLEVKFLVDFHAFTRDVDGRAVVGRPGRSSAPRVGILLLKSIAFNCSIFSEFLREGLTASQNLYNARSRFGGD